MRAFIAIDLPEKLKTTLAQLQEDLKTCNLGFKWVKPNNIHLTLKFLGNIEESKLSEIKTIISKASLRSQPFEAALSGFGFFPNEKKPRVFFAKTNNQKQLQSLVNRLEKALEKIGFPIEGRFKSHITLARIKTQENIETLKEKIKAIKIEATLPIEAIILYKSRLTASGAIYEKIASSPLAA